MNSSNTWGWIGLILVAVLVGAGFLYQREGGRLFPLLAQADKENSEPKGMLSVPDGDRQADKKDAVEPQADVDNPPKTSDGVGVRSPSGVIRKSSFGTVSVTLKFPVVYQTLESRPLGPWLYIKSNHGQTRDDFWSKPEQAYVTLPEESQLGNGRGWSVCAKTLSLAPGDYVFEAVVEGYDSESSFPLRVQSQRVHVVAGQSSKIAISFPTTVTCSPLYSDESVTALGGRERNPQDVNAWVAEREARIRRQANQYELDPLVDALKRASDALGNLPPKKPTTLVNLRDSQGGPRELDAAQVRMLVRYLEKLYWQDLKGERLGLKSEAFKLPNAKQVFDTLAAQDTLIQQLVDEVRELNALARKLDQAPTQ